MGGNGGDEPDTIPTISCSTPTALEANGESVAN